MHNFCAKMCQYFYYTYCLQEELTYFDLRELTNFGLKVSAQSEPKHHQYNKYHQYSHQCSELYQRLILNSLN